MSAGPERAGPIIEVGSLGKSYGRNEVLRDVSFAVRRGERVALIGENGAGKSTMARLLSGAARPDRGRYLVDGRETEFRSPRDAMRAGVALIPQELAYVPEMTVGENLLLGRWPARFGVTSRRAAKRAALQALEPFDLELDPSRVMRDLSLAERQIVEIAKALIRDTRLVVLDEPTAALNEQESRSLLTLLRGLSDHGLGMIYISHRFEEVMSFADRVCVLRNGEMVFDAAPGETSRQELIEKMVGSGLAERDEELKDEAVESAREASVRLTGWSHEGSPRLDGVDVTFHRGEIVVLFGVRGSGAELVSDGLAGKCRAIDGTIEIGGKARPVFMSPRQASRAGVAYVPPDRKSEGLVLALSVSENLALTDMGTGFGLRLVDKARRKALMKRSVETFDLRARDGAQPVSELSGGNQQKVLLSSRLTEDPELFVLHEPTRGVDVGARRQIHDELRTLAGRGIAISAVTSDVEEAVILGDRILVFRDGRIVNELTGEERTQANALSAAGGLIHA